jgi:type III secretion protein W
MPQGAGAGQSIASTTVSAQSPVGTASLLAQSADELAFGLAAKVQERTLKERKVSESRLMRPDRARVQTLMQAFANKGGQAAAAESAASQQLAALAKRIKDKPSSARQEAQDELGNDPTLQYLGLLSLAYQNQDGSSGGDPGGGSESALWEAIEELSAEKGDRIAADLNTFEATQGLPPEHAQAFRGAYKDVVLASESLAQAGQHILSATQGDSGEAFMQTLKRLTQALGLDLAAARHSTEPARLKSLLTDLYHLETIATVVDRCSELSRTLQARHGTPPLAATALASDMVALSGERWMDSTRVLRLGEKHGSQHSLATAVDLLTGLRGVIRELPVWAFQSNEARDSLLVAAQDAIDVAIDREEGLA